MGEDELRADCCIVPGQFCADLLQDVRLQFTQALLYLADKETEMLMCALQFPIVNAHMHKRPGYALYDQGIERDVFVKDVTGSPYMAQVCSIIRSEITHKACWQQPHKAANLPWHDERLSLASFLE